MRAGRCCRSRCTARRAAPPRCATSPSAPVCPSPTSSRSCWPSRAPGWCARSGASAAATCWPARRRRSPSPQIVSAVDGPIVAGDFGEPHTNGACDHEGQCVLLAIWADVGEHMRQLPRRRRPWPTSPPWPRARPPWPARRDRRSALIALGARASAEGGQHRRQVGGQRRRRTPARSPVTGWAKRQARGVQERPRTGSDGSRARRSGRRRRRGARWPARCTRIWWVRPGLEPALEQRDAARARRTVASTS